MCARAWCYNLCRCEFICIVHTEKEIDHEDMPWLDCIMGTRGVSGMDKMN